MTMKEEYTAIDMATAAADGFRAGQRAAQSAGVPDGWALVPKRMSLSPADIAAIMFQCGGDEDAEEFEDRFNGGVLWVGETLDDDGSKSYGLNIACVECLEEGSTLVVEFSPPTMLAAPTVKAEQVEVVAWLDEGPEQPDCTASRRVMMDWANCGYTIQPLMTVAQHNRIVAALSAQQSAQPEFCCEHSYKVAKQAAWGARDLTKCKCDHNEYCEHCWPDDFKEGGKWHNGFEAQQSAPERVSVPVELAERIATHLEWDGEESLTVVQYANKCDALAGELRALLASHAEGGKV